MPTRREEIEEILVYCHDVYEQTYAREMAFSDDVKVPLLVQNREERSIKQLNI